MENPLRKQIRSIMKDHKKRQMWYRIVTTLAVVVVFVTTYMLILPAITMENKAECGITEHKHDANCYSSHYEKEKELACTTDSLGVHKHTDVCYDAEHKLICGYADFVIHEHDASCYDKDGNLVCTIPEHKLHQHTPECYQMQKQLVCTQEESVGHTHTPECYTKQQGALICGKEEHTHGEGCYDAEGNLICTLEEHTHSDECYEWTDVLTCTIPESAGHTHSEACYQDVQVLICEEPAELHTHTAECYKDGVLACGKLELKEHKHSETCFTEKQVLVETLICDRVEHVHTDECYKGSGQSEEQSSVVSEEVTSEEVTSGQIEEVTSEEASTEENSTEEISSEELSTEEVSTEEVSTEEVSLEETSTEENSSQIEDASSEEETTSEVDTDAEETSLEAVSEEESEAESETEPESESEESSSIEAESSEEESSEEESFEETSTEETSEEELTSEEASTEENTSEAEKSGESSWCIVYRSEEDLTSDSESSVRRSPRRAVSCVNAVQSGDESVSLDSYVRSVTVSKIENGVETTVDPSGLKEGDNVKVDIKYEIENGLPDGKNTLVYQLPQNIKLSKERSGSVMQVGTDVGTYHIATDGKITIVIDKTKFDPSRSFTGDVGFEGTAQMTGENDSEEMKFPGSTTSIIINRDKTQYDLTVSKTAKLSDDRKTIDYTVTVSSNKGTNNESVSITDKFSGDATGTYRQDSFKLVKIDQNGNKTDVSVKPSFTTENGYQKFDYTDLPALGKGESYELTYKADVTPNDKGGGTVTNTAGAKTPNKQDWKTENTKIPGTIISKIGSIEWWPKKLIKWEIKVNEDEVADIGGYVLKDNLPGNLDTEKGITISPALPDGTTKINNFPFTFPENAGKNAYTITYYTQPPTTAGEVKNTATIGKDGKETSASGSVSYSPRGEGINKSFSGEGKDQEQDVLNWTSTISLSEDYQTEIIYSDTILNTTDKDGNLVTDASGKNPHYAIASKLQNTLQSGNNIQLELEDGTKLNYEQAVAQGYQFEFKFYEAKGSTEIAGNDSTGHVGYYTVKVTKKDGTSFQAKSLTLQYYTYADYSSMPEGDKWTLKNQAGYHDQTSEGKTDHGDPSSLKKESGIKNQGGGINYSTLTSVKYDDIADGYLYYRLILTTSSEHNEALTLTDTLSDSEMKFDVDSLKVKFAKHGNVNDLKDDWTAYLGSDSYKYDLNGAQKPTASVTGQTMTITIQGGYNKGKIGDSEVFDNGEKNHTFVITYRVKISDDPHWKDLSQTYKKYGNTVTWEKLTTSTETEVKERNVENVEKSGKQRVATDKDGNVIKDTDGNPLYLEMVDYQIVINPKGEDLLTGTDTITLSDTLTITDESGNVNENSKKIKAYLEMDSVKLYQYDAEAENHIGNLYDRSVYKLYYDDSNLNAPTIKVELPDKTPCILVYTYNFDKGALNSAYKVKNEAQLSGKNQSNSEIRIEKNSSYANVDQSELSIYKVDEDDQSVRLGNTKFKLEEYSNGSWSVVTYANPSENGGTKEGEGKDTVYVTSQDGYLRFEKYNKDGDNASKGLLKKDTIYRLTEVEAPTGYELNKTPYHFVILGSKTSSDFDTEMQTATSGSGKVYYFKAGKKVALYITNKFTGVSVRKVWLDENGGIQASGMPDSIQVQLYQQKTQLDARTVTLVFKDYNGNDTKYQPQTYSVKPGTEFSIEFSNFYNDFTYEWNGNSKREGGSAYNNCEIGIIENDTTIVIKSWGWNKHDPSKVIKLDYVKASYTTGNGVKTTVGSPITLSATNNWQYTWINESGSLPANADDGAPYYYSVEEVSVPTGYSVSYINNNGIIVGGNEMVITNKADKKPIVLPETGGTGTYWYTMGGVLLIAGAAFLIYKKHMQKGGRRIW